MTFSIGHVEGGTGAGRKRPLLPAYTIPWTCACRLDDELVNKSNPGYLKRCIDCGAERP